MQAQPRDGDLERVKAALEAESFPTPKENLYYAIGDMVLEEDGTGRQVPVRDVLDRVDASSFETVGDAVVALRDAFAGVDPSASPAPPARGSDVPGAGEAGSD